MCKVVDFPDWTSQTFDVDTAQCIKPLTNNNLEAFSLLVTIDLNNELLI